MASSGSGPDAGRDHASRPTSATKTPISSAPSVRRAEQARRWPCLMPTLSPCSFTYEISRHVAKGAHAVLLLDRAGWHTTTKLRMPKNIMPIFLPSRAPELNPVESIWQYLRANWLSNRVFETYEAIIDAACEPGESSSLNPTRSPQSESATGLTSVSPGDRWYNGYRVDGTLQSVDDFMSPLNVQGRRIKRLQNDEKRSACQRDSDENTCEARSKLAADTNI